MFASDFQEGQIAGLFPNPIYLMPIDAYPGETSTPAGTALASARTSFAMSAVSGSSRSNSAQVQITVATAGRHRFFQIWDAASAGNYLGYAVAGNNTPQSCQLTDTTNDDIVCVGHGFVADDEVFFLQEPGGKVLPAPLAEGTVYYVIATGLTANSFRVSTTQGGAAVNITAAGSGLVCKISYKNYGVGDIIQVAAAGLTITGY